MKSAIKKHKYLIATVAFAAMLLALITGVFSVDNSTNKMVVEYVGSLGWIVDASPAEITRITIPTEFDTVYETYNAVQKTSGFDLTEFKGKSVSRYIYRLKNHKQSKDSKVMLGVIVYENRIIAGDISSTDMNGFMHSLIETDNIDPDYTPI